MTQLEVSLIAAVVGLIMFVLGRLWGDKRFEAVKTYVDQKLDTKRSKDVCDGMREECEKWIRTGFDNICERLRRIEDRLDKINNERDRSRNEELNRMYERGDKP